MSPATPARIRLCVQAGGVWVTFGTDFSWAIKPNVLLADSRD